MSILTKQGRMKLIATILEIIGAIIMLYILWLVLKSLFG